MVDLQNEGRGGRDPYSDSAVRPSEAVIDDEILLAFERGAHLHVEKSLDAVKKDLEARADTLMALIPQITPASALNDAVLRAAAQVVTDTRFMLVMASRLQAELTDKVSSGDTTADAKRTFYRKNYARTRGIVTQVQEVADAIFLLSDSCAQATEGSDDVEKIQSHVGNLRGTIARLLTQADVKMHSVLDRNARGDQLHEAAGNVKKSAHNLEAKVRGRAVGATLGATGAAWSMPRNTFFFLLSLWNSAKSTATLRRRESGGPTRWAAAPAPSGAIVVSAAPAVPLAPPAPMAVTAAAGPCLRCSGGCCCWKRRRRS